MTKIHCFYLRGKLYAWTTEKDILNLFIQQRSPSKFRYKQKKVESISNLDQKKKLTMTVLESEGEVHKIIVTLDENARFEHTVSIIEQFFRYMRNIYVDQEILPDEDKQVLDEITKVLVDDELLVDNRIVIDELHLFTALFDSTL